MKTGLRIVQIWRGLVAAGAHHHPQAHCCPDIYHLALRPRPDRISGIRTQFAERSTNRARSSCPSCDYALPIVGRLAELVAPSRLGVGFRWLLPSSWLTNLGDGFALAAGPLLVASLTHDAFLVALAATFQWLPPLLFAPIAGAVTDRHHRLRIVVLVNLVRVGMLVVLVLAIVTGQGSSASC